MGRSLPEDFNFGPTRWTTIDQTQRLLRELLQQKVDEGHPSLKAPLRPVVILSHGIGDTLSILRRHFGVDIRALGHVVGMLDIQDIALEVGRTGSKEISMRKLSWVLGIDPSIIKNCGNSAAMMLMSAVLMAEPQHGHLSPALPAQFSTNTEITTDTEMKSSIGDGENAEREWSYSPPSSPIPPQYLRGRHPGHKILIHTHVSELVAMDPSTALTDDEANINVGFVRMAIENAWKKPAPRWGVSVYCLRCNRVNDHLEKDCDGQRNKVFCVKCKLNGLPKKVVESHHTMRCVRRDG